MKVISQEEFDRASELLDAIVDEKRMMREAGSLKDKLTHKRRIDELHALRMEILK